MINLFFASLVLFICWEIFKIKKFLSSILFLLTRQRDEEVIKNKFPKLFFDYRDDLLLYWERVKRSKKSVNEEDYDAHWTFILMHIQDRCPLHIPECEQIDRLGDQTNELIKSSKKILTRQESDFLAWMMWRELSDMENQTMIENFSRIAEKYFSYSNNSKE